MKAKTNGDHRRIELGRHVVADSKICGGQPTFKGTRIMVWIILEQLARGMSWRRSSFAAFCGTRYLIPKPSGWAEWSMLAWEFGKRVPNSLAWQRRCTRQIFKHFNRAIPRLGTRRIDGCGLPRSGRRESR